jgi:uncharacterized protein YjbJ (UPF0337 family)
MNWDTIHGNWKQLRGKVREQWGDLTDDEFDRMAGKRDQMVGVLQKRYGWARDDAEQRADAFAHSLRDHNFGVGNGMPGVQTGGRAMDGTPDTRGVMEKVADAVTGDRIDDKTGKVVR